MAAPTEIYTTVSGRVACEDDFTFSKNKEELAVRVRSEAAPNISQVMGGQTFRVSLDEEGDITLNSPKAFMFLTRSGVTCSVSGAELNSLADSPEVRSIPTALEYLVLLRAAIQKPIEYSVRVFVPLRRPTSAFLAALSRTFPANEVPVPGAILDFSTSVSAEMEIFRENLEIRADRREVAIRFGWDSDPTRFASYGEFWRNLDFARVFSRVSPIIDLYLKHGGPEPLPRLGRQPAKSP